MAKQWDITQAPINAQELQPAGVIIRWIVGVLLIGYSTITTIIIIDWFFTPVLHGAWIGISYGMWIGLLLSAIVTVVEWVTSEKYKLVHWVVVVFFDASFTSWQTYTWLSFIMASHYGNLDTYEKIATGAVALLIGLSSAKLGEALLVRQG